MHEYFEDAIDSTNRDLAEKVLFPSKTTFLGKRWDGWRENSRQRAIENCDSRLLLTHTDADGLVSGALFKDFFWQNGEEDIEVVEVDYDQIEDTFEYILEEGDGITELYVSDLNLDDLYPAIEEVAEMVPEFVWIDHHEWGDKENALSDWGIEMHINQDRCAAGLVYNYLKDRGYESRPSVRETVKLTEDHDLWNHEMETIKLGEYDVCISKAFSQMAFFSDSDVFMDTVLDYGLDFMDYEAELLRGDKGSGFIAARENEHNLKIEYIIDNETSIEEIEGVTVGFAHGRASPGELLEQLVETEGIDMLVHTKPMYPPKASLRGADDGFDECHLVAQKLNGGGHAKAAGCSPEGIANRPMEFLEYVTSHGEPLKNEIRTAIKNHLTE